MSRLYSASPLISLAQLIGGIPGYLLVLLFGFAGFDKLAHYGRFVAAVNSYHVVASTAAHYIALFLIMAEILIAVGLLIPRWRRPASFAGIALLISFTTLYLTAAPEDICGCWFTLTLAKGGNIHVLQNLIFIALGVITWLDNRSSPATSERKRISVFTWLHSAVVRRKSGEAQT